MQNFGDEAQRDRTRARAGAPAEWLFSVMSEKGGHARLLAESGSLAVAAFRLALARCRSSAVATEVPSAQELRGAAREILRRAGLSVELPKLAELIAECESQGLLVI